MSDAFYWWAKPGTGRIGYEHAEKEYECPNEHCKEKFKTLARAKPGRPIYCPKCRPAHAAEMKRKSAAKTYAKLKAKKAEGRPILQSEPLVSSL